MGSGRASLLEGGQRITVWQFSGHSDVMVGLSHWQNEFHSGKVPRVPVLSALLGDFGMHGNQGHLGSVLCLAASIDGALWVHGCVH